MEEEQRKLLERAIDEFGIESQLDIVTEELCECSADISRYFRGRNDIDDLTEETADALFMLRQLCIIVGESRVEKRIENKNMDELESRLSGRNNG